MSIVHNYDVLISNQKEFTRVEKTQIGKGCKNQIFVRCFRPQSEEGFLSCHTCCDTGPYFFQSYPNDQSISSLYTTNTGHHYSNPDPHRKDIDTIIYSPNISNLVIKTSNVNCGTTQNLILYKVKPLELRSFT